MRPAPPMQGRYATARYQVIIEQSEESRLRSGMEMWLTPFQISYPQFLRAYQVQFVGKVTPELSNIVFSPRLVNDDPAQRPNVGGYLLRMEAGNNPDNLSAYKTIAKVSVSDVQHMIRTPRKA